jgi:hypothetical protein
VGRGGNGWPAMLGLDLRGGSRWGGGVNCEVGHGGQGRVLWRRVVPVFN